MVRQARTLPKLEIRLLGDFYLRADGEVIAGLHADRPQSLLAYLLLNRNTPQSRQHLAFLLWPDSTDGQARTNLRNLLYTLRHTLPEASTFLAADATTVQWVPTSPFDLDVAQFESAIRQADQSSDQADVLASLETAVAVYQGDLLPNNYDDWMTPIREELRQNFETALRRLVALLEEKEDYNGAVRHCQRLIHIDPFDEASAVQMMRLQAKTGNRAGIRRTYQTLEMVLQRELGVELSQSTQEAFAQLLRFEMTPAPILAAAKPTAWQPRPLPIPPTPFIGREHELKEVAKCLVEPNCRLVTILGLGGMGKTRLALQTAAAHQTHFEDGVGYISLTPLRMVDHIVPAIAEAINFPLAGPAEPLWQLQNFLQAKEMLLVLDNFEHLLEGSTLLSTILAQAPRIKIITTSRQRLDIQEEWVFELQGLSTPTRSNENPPIENSAVLLFQHSARRIQHDFVMTEEDQASIVKICHLVGGMPLGLELAASWIRSLSCAEIAAEIERNLDFLTVTTRNLEERHRSMRALFDQSWRLLTVEERQILQQLSVFRGSFSREAAASIANANLAVLAGLVEKMLVQRTGKDFYELHELIRQFAATCLQENPEEEKETRSRHAKFYLSLLQQAEPILQGERQKEALTNLNYRLDNIRAAWEFVVDSREIELIQGSAWPLWYYYELRNYFQEGELLMASSSAEIQSYYETLKRSGQNSDSQAIEILLADLLAHRAFFCIRMGRNLEAISLLEFSIKLLRPYNVPIKLAHALAHHGLACWLVGHFEAAAASLRECLPLSDAQNQSWQLPLFTAFLGVVVHELGNFEEAFGLLNEAALKCRALGDPRLITFSASYLSRTAQVLGRNEDVHGHLEEGLRVATETEDRFGMGLILERLAVEAQLQKNYQEAARLFEQGFALFSEIGDQWSLARTLLLMGQLSSTQSDWPDAEKKYHQSFEIARAVHQYPIALEALAGLMALYIETNRNEAAMELSLFILQHPSSSQLIKDTAVHLQHQLKSQLPEHRIKAIEQKMQNRPIDLMLTNLFAPIRPYAKS